MSRPDVHIVDDDAAMRDSLRELVASAGMVPAVYASAEEFLAAYDSLTTGCLVLDIRMTGLCGLSVQQHLRDRGSDLPVIILTAHGDVPAATRAFKQGAVDFIQKPADPQELLHCICGALERYHRESERNALQREVAANLAKLTAREREVMDLVVAGLANKQIAARLGIAERTVEDHRARVMRTMGAHSVAQLVRLAAACLK